MCYSIEHCPTRLIDVWNTPDGRRVTLRPVLPQDAALEQALVRALSPSSRYQRFFTPIRELPASWLSRMTQIDDLQHLALIVAGVVQLACELPLLRPEFGLGHERSRPTLAG